MDIKNKLFKFKRAVRRNRELISRIFSITLTVALLVVVAWGAYKIYLSDQAVRAEENMPEPEDEKIPTGKAPKEDLDAFDLVASTETLRLYANQTNGEVYVEEIASGKKWYTNPVDRAEDKILVSKPTINAQFNIKFYNEKTRTPIDKAWNNYQHSIKKGGMVSELVPGGIKYIFSFPTANVRVPVQYTLSENGGFKAQILTSEIEGVGNNPYLITSIEFLPYFGAAGLEETGELFVPDGSGTLMTFNSNKKSAFYNSEVYGKNITLAQPTAENPKEQITMPIFGAVMKSGTEDVSDDHAFIGVITHGETSSLISARTSKQTDSYNRVYPTANLYETQLIFSDTNVHVGVATKVLAKSDELMNGGNYTIEYYFLNGEDANYVGMAEKYREHLAAEQKLKDSDLTDSKYLVLDLIGAVSIEKYVFGIKQPVVTPLTTYNEVVEIVEELRGKGVENLIVNYIGALDSGLNNEMFSSVKTESVLGSKKEFQNMIDTLAGYGVKLFIETNPVDLYNNGHGYDTNADAAKTFFDKYAFQYKYILDSDKSDNASRWHLLHPAKVPGFMQTFADSIASWGLTNISVDRLGTVLYSDYADDVPSTTRIISKDLWCQAMATADAKANYLMLHGGNAYTLAYADIISDVPSSSSNYDITDADVPFYQIAFQHNTVLTPRALNTSVDYTYEFLKTLETGTSLKYNLIYADVASLVGTEYNTMVSYSYAYWKDIVVDQYLKMQSAASQFAGKQIVAHEQITEDIALTTYENGKIVINYGTEAYTYEGVTIGPRDYAVLAGGAK